MLYAILLAVGLTYPALYDFQQLYQDGIKEYFSDFWNYIDFIYIYGSIANILCQLYFGPYHISSRVLMMTIVTILISKTFFFLRIFPVLTPIVVMIINVIDDLKVFLAFYFILVLGFAQVFAVLGLGNTTGDGKVDPFGPAKEFSKIGLHPGDFVWTFRLSVGDYGAIQASKELDSIEAKLFWVLWCGAVCITSIIFLNFVVAEACASYNKVI